MVTNDVTIKSIRILLLGRFIKGARTEMSHMLNSWPMVELGIMHHTLVQKKTPLIIWNGPQVILF